MSSTTTAAASPAAAAAPPPPSVLMVGAGEYNVGYVPTNKAGAAPDKKAGVTALVLLDLKAKGRVGRILLADAVGTRLPNARATMQEKIGSVYSGLDVGCIECFPADDVAFDADAYLLAMDTMRRGDAVIIFTPDDTHATIARAGIERGLHVLVAKPLVKKLEEHVALEEAARKAGVVLATEYHKRWDPMYHDAASRIKSGLMGPFVYFYSAMTQRREQLDTFAGWAGRSSDISYYLNSHHIDIHAWAMHGRSRPVSVTATASEGVANARLGRGGIEDTITLVVVWEEVGGSGSRGHAVYMASWVAPTADCHTQQGFHAMFAKGEVRVDQAHRGYSLSADADAGGTGGFASLNPLYMRYTPDHLGRFAGQSGYGYKSIEAFVDVAGSVQRGELTSEAVESGQLLATAGATRTVTAILEAGRRSLDSGRPVKIVYDGEGSVQPVRLE